MTTHSNFKNEIESIVAFAKATNFDMNTGDFDELMRNWINRTKMIHDEIMANYEDVIRLIKSIV